MTMKEEEEEGRREWWCSWWWYGGVVVVWFDQQVAYLYIQCGGGVCLVCAGSNISEGPKKRGEGRGREKEGGCVVLSLSLCE